MSPGGPERPYVPLWCKSVYSFLEGASHPDELIEEAYRMGIHALALTDRDGVYGIVRAHKTAEELGVHLLVGSEIALLDDSRLIVLAIDREGYANLCGLISRGRLRSAKGMSHVGVEEVCEHAEGLIALWGGARSSLAGEAEPRPMAGALRDAFGDRLYALLTRHRESGDARIEHRLRQRAERYGMPLAAGMETLYHAPPRRELQDVLTCIRHNVALPAAGRIIYPNAEHALRSPQSFCTLYADEPRAIARTVEIAARCRFSLKEIRYVYPSEPLPDGTTSAQFLRDLTLKGAQSRYNGNAPPDVIRQIEKELNLIHALEYEGYFLTMHEIVSYCRHKNILCQGRGSAANSVVCYCLGITAVDPVRMGLLFERFLSKERAEPPDIDLDIEHNRREEVIQHVYAKYGRDHAAMVANFIRYRARSAVRDVGKALGVPESTLERLAQFVSHYEVPSEAVFAQAGLDPACPIYEHLLRIVRLIEDVPRHLSIHPGGFLLGHEPVSRLVPIENATMPDRTVIQWDKEDVEELGLFKVDLLGLGALNVVHRTLDLIQESSGQTHTLATIPPDDPPTFTMIRQGDSAGVFQIESRAQMAMLPRLKPANYYDLVIEVSIVRPGPITGGMVHPYLRRRSGEEEVTYPHACLRPILEKTLGIPLFQEQVMQLAIVAADYTPGEADQLRRDMAAWRKSGRIERHRERLIPRMMRKGIGREFAERVFEQIRGFGEYGFPESHAASFALIAYATAWMKCHHPAAFLCALLNAQPMGFYSPDTLVQDAKRHGVLVKAVNVQRSQWDCTLEPAPGSGEGFAVRIGLRYVKGLSENDAERVSARRAMKPFASFDDFTFRTGLNGGALTRLAESGALECFKAGRRDALWDALAALPEPDSALALPSVEAPVDFAPLDAFETIQWDYALTGHSPRGHPLAVVREALTQQGLPDAATIRRLPNGSRVRYAGIVICRQRPGTAKGVVFMTLEDESGFVNLVIWERVYREYELLAKTQSFLGVSGKLQLQSDVAHLVVEKFWRPDIDKRLHAAKSRDFH
ncbi:MAG: error-prone DNA polymerase [Candidatus Hydrogenedentes bacterium]|nr:error-prone DNA polymerase [Candidatus Hydrogenedentota bacterium]